MGSGLLKLEVFYRMNAEKAIPWRPGRFKVGLRKRCPYFVRFRPGSNLPDINLISLAFDPAGDKIIGIQQFLLERFLCLSKRRKNMKIKSETLIAAVISAVFIIASSTAWPLQRDRSGSYSGRRGDGTFQKQTTRTQGELNRNTTWQNRAGSGERNVAKTWDKSTQTGTVNSSTTLATGKTMSKSGDVKKNENGTYSATGTITGPQGGTTTVDKVISRNEDGSKSVSSIYTGPGDNTLSTEKNVQKTDTGREVTGTYMSDTGKSGSFGQTITVSEGSRSKEQHLTDQDNQTWSRDVSTSREGNSITRAVEVENPEGEVYSHTGSVTLDEKSEK